MKQKRVGIRLLFALTLAAVFSTAPAVAGIGQVTSRDLVGSPSGLFSPTPTPTPTSTPGPASTVLANISTRGTIDTPPDVLIGGFIVTGTLPKRVLVRAIGPSLPLFGRISDTFLELHDSTGGVIAVNDDWRTDQEAEIITTGIPPTNDFESAILATLPANNSAYTAIVSGFNGANGIGLVEVYDLDRTVDSRMINISTRGLVTIGDNVLIGGIIITGSIPTRVLFRAIGPSLALMGVPNSLIDPTLELHDGNGAVIAFNDDWRTDQQSEIIATGLAPTVDQESAIVDVLLPGRYTAIVDGFSSLTGVALVEAFQLQ